MADRMKRLADLPDPNDRLRRDYNATETELIRQGRDEQAKLAWEKRKGR